MPTFQVHLDGHCISLVNAVNCCQCSQVHLKVSALVQWIPGYYHSGILVRHLSHTHSGIKWQNFISLILQEYSQMLLKWPVVIQMLSICYELWPIGLLNFDVAETWIWVCNKCWEQLKPLHKSTGDFRIHVVFSPKLFLGFYNQNPLWLSHLSWLDICVLQFEEDSLYLNMGCIIYIHLSIYIHIVNVATETTAVQSETQQHMRIE